MCSRTQRISRCIAVAWSTSALWYESERSCGDTVLLSVGEVAQRLGVSRATVERCERVLRERGAIERRCFKHRQASLVVLRRAVTAVSESASAGDGQRAARAAPQGNASDASLHIAGRV